MPIFAYTGLPGHGKSYGVVENVILPALQQGRHVVTNIPLNEKRIRQDYKNGIISGFPMEAVKADPERVFEFALPGCVLVLDELWNLIPAGLAANKVPEPFKKLLAEHRHMVDVSGDSMSIYFVTQDCGQLAAFARILVEQTFHINKLNAVGLSKQYRLDIYNGVVTGQSPPVSKRVNSIMGTYKKKTFEYYQSHTQSQSEATGANERSIDSRGVFWKNWKFLAGGPIALGVLAWGIAQGVGYFNPERAKPKAEGPSVARTEGAGERATWRSSLLGGAVPLQARPRISAVIEVQGFARTMVVVEDGTRSELLRFSDACYRVTGGEMVCLWNGVEVKGRGATYGNRTPGIQSGPAVSAAPGIGPARSVEMDRASRDAARARAEILAEGPAEP